MANPEQPGQDFSQWKAPKQDTEKREWIVERGVRFDPALPAETRERIITTLTAQEGKIKELTRDDATNRPRYSLSWFEHLGMGSTEPPTTEVLKPYLVLSGKMTIAEVADLRTKLAERESIRFQSPGLDLKRLKGQETQGDRLWDAHLSFADDESKQKFIEFAETFTPDPEIDRIVMGTEPLELDEVSGNVRMPKVSSLGEFDPQPLPPDLQGKVSFESFRVSDNWINPAGTKNPLPVAAWVDKDGLRIESVAESERTR